MHNYNSVIDIIKSGSRFLIASHAHPDGDGIGSTIALAKGIESFGGKTVVMFNADRVPYNLMFLPYSDEVVSKLPQGISFDATFLVDCADISRVEGDVGALDKSKTGRIVLIDHHAMKGGQCDVSCIDEDASATGEVIYRILKGAGVKITGEIANLIFCTFVVDTGSFRYSNTTAGLLRDAAELMEAGADPWKIAMAIYESDPVSYIKLLRLTLSTFDITSDGKIAWLVLTQQMLAEAGTSVEVAEEFVNFPRSIKGVEVAILFRELEDGRWKISFRSKDDIDVQKIAGIFGGGGHSHAAGCKLKGSLADVKARIFEEVFKCLSAKCLSRAEKFLT